MDISTKKRRSLTEIAMSTETHVKTEKTTGIYRNSEFTIKTEAEAECYLPYGREYAESRGWAVTAVLSDALNLRASGEKVLSAREADIAARGKIMLEDKTVELSLVCSNGKKVSPIQDIGGMQFHLVEGTENLSLITEDCAVGLPDDIYQMRLMWNRGVDFYLSGRYNSSTAEQKAKADETIEKLRRCFALCSLSPWPEEDIRPGGKGFHHSLCKPEWMTVEQYAASRQNASAFIATMKRVKQ